jgi:hypothetical protein
MTRKPSVKNWIIRKHPIAATLSTKKLSGGEPVENYTTLIGKIVQRYQLTVSMSSKCNLFLASIHTKLHQSKNRDTLMNHEKLVMTLFKSRVNAFK